jgi:hypothetical protein
MAGTNMVNQRVVAAILTGMGPNGSAGVEGMWLCAFATDGKKLVTYYPDNVPQRERDIEEEYLQGTFRGMQEAGISYDTDPERYMKELGRHPMGGSTDTQEFPTFDAAEQAALATFQTPVN